MLSKLSTTWGMQKKHRSYNLYGSNAIEINKTNLN